MKWGAFKPVLADAVVDHVAPIQARARPTARPGPPGPR